MSAALTVRGLRITYPGPPPVHALDGVDLDLRHGECLAVFGESGSGKSSLARATLGLLGDARCSGSVHLGDTDLAALDENGWRAVRWQRLALVFQSSSALNPVLRVGAQVAEAVQVHWNMRSGAAKARAEDVLEWVGLAADQADRYPRELSGGERRLALLAVALACDPDVLILDEPTAGLDPITRGHVLTLLAQLRAQHRSLLLLTHDIEAVSQVADRTMVLYRGWVAEHGPVARVIDDPRHPYSVGLLNARPTLATIKDLRGIRGDPPDPTSVAAGCPFLPRCTQSIDRCADGRPGEVVPDGEDEAGRLVACVRGGLVQVVRARNLRKSYPVHSRGLQRRRVDAVADVSLDVREGEVVGLVGPNGAGKSTVGLMLLRLLEPDAGSVELEGQDLLAAEGPALTAARRRAQMLFQDPAEALSPRLSVADAVREPLDVQRIGTPAQRAEAVRRALTDARLPSNAGFLQRRAHELSGGQLARVALARALVLEPKLLVADEPLEGLDPSERATILQLLKTLQVERGMAMVLISHDLAVMLRVADRVMVLDGGRIVEQATGTRLLLAPQHPVTRALLAAAGRDPALSMNGGPAAHDGPPHTSEYEEDLRCAETDSPAAWRR